MSESSLLTKAISLNKKSGSSMGNPISKLKTISLGINAPFNVFRTLCKEFNINNAALLMLDLEKNIFFPIIYRNYDQTTALRLQLTQVNINDLLEKKIKIQKFFSYNDSRSINGYFFLNLSIEKQPFYFLHTSTTNNSIIPNYVDFINKNRKLISSILYSYKKNASPPEKKEIPPLFTAQANIFIKERSKRNFSFFFFAIDAKNFLKKIQSISNKNTNPFKLENDILTVFETNFTDFGIITRINYGECLILLQLETTTSADLIAHHLNSSLMDHYDNHKKLSPLKVVYTKYFETISTINKAASDLLVEL